MGWRFWCGGCGVVVVVLPLVLLLLLFGNQALGGCSSCSCCLTGVVIVERVAVFCVVYVVGVVVFC